ncbi:MAG: radical SAM protein [Desulfatibacillum sp.]|nr:radical SAM protein [Desulfatibacillum sp.]
MKKQTIISMVGLLSAMLQKRRFPASMGMIVTHRCNLRCTYCGFPGIPANEMDTSDWLDAIDSFLNAGTLRMGFSGGEPLLREDLGALLKSAHGRALVTLNTNGLLLPQRKEVLNHVDVVVISLDGNRDIHDSLRGHGAFEGALRGGESALSAGKRLVFSTVLTRENQEQIPFIIRTAKEMGAQCTFQPVTPCDVSSMEASKFLPEKKALLHNVKQLAAAKRRGLPVCCSRAYLDLLSRYPDVSAMGKHCLLGRYGAFVTPSGNVCRCHVHMDITPMPPGNPPGYLESFHGIPLRVCKGCLIYPYVEFTQIFNGNPHALLNVLGQAFKGMGHIAK